MTGAYEIFIVVCNVIFALVSIGIFVITVIKFIRHIRAELKGEYGKPNKPLIIASVAGAVILTVLSVLTVYLSIKMIKDITAKRDKPHTAQIITAPRVEPPPPILPVIEIETETETETPFVELVFPDRYCLISFEYEEDIEHSELEERELGASENDFAVFTRCVKRGENVRVRMSESGQRTVYEKAKEYGLPYRVVLALLGIETDWNEDAEHTEINKGVRYIGIGCINEKYHADNMSKRGIDIYTLDGNIAAVCWLIKAQYDRFGTIELALMAYNGGGGYTQSQIERGVTGNSYSQHVIDCAESFER